MVARALRPLLAWMRPVEGTLAADSLIQAPRRTSGTVAALMLSLALVISLGGLARASYDSIFDWMSIALNPDLFVTTSESLTSRSFRVPGFDGAELRAIGSRGSAGSAQPHPGVVARRSWWWRRMCIAGPPGDLAARAGRCGGDVSLAAEGKGVLASENFARLRHHKLGEMLDIPSPGGMLRLPIVGIVTDFSDQQGSILIDRSLFKRYWNDDTVNIFRIYLQPGADEADVNAGSWKHSARQRLFVLTNRDVRNYIIRLTDQWFGITVRADRGGGAGGRAGNRQRADGFDHGPAARTRRAARGGRTAWPDSPDDLDGGSQYRRGGADSGPRIRRAAALLQLANYRHRRGGITAQVRISISDFAGAGAGDSRGGVYVVIGAGGIAVRGSLVEALEYE